MKMKKRYKKACNLWFSKEMSKEVFQECAHNYGFDDEDLDNIEIQYNILCLFRDMYFERYAGYVNIKQRPHIEKLTNLPSLTYKTDTNEK